MKCNLSSIITLKSHICGFLFQSELELDCCNQPPGKRKQTQSDRKHHQIHYIAIVTGKRSAMILIITSYIVRCCHRPVKSTNTTQFHLSFIKNNQSMQFYFSYFILFYLFYFISSISFVFLFYLFYLFYLFHLFHLFYFLFMLRCKALEKDLL